MACAVAAAAQSRPATAPAQPPRAAQPTRQVQPQPAQPPSIPASPPARTVPQPVVVTSAAASPTAAIPALDDAILILSTPDLNRLADGFARTFAARHPRLRGAGGGLSPAVGDILAESAGRLAKITDQPVASLRSPFGGPAAICILAPSIDGLDRPRAVALLGVRDHALARELYNKAIANLIRVTGRHDQVDAAPHRIDVFGRESPRAGQPNGVVPAGAAAPPSASEFGLMPDVAEEEPLRALIAQLTGGLWTTGVPATFAACLTMDQLIIGGSAADVRAALGSTRGANALRDPILQAAASRVVDSRATLVLLANVPRLFEGIEPLDEVGVRELFLALGGRALRSLSASWRFGDADCDTRAEFEIGLEGPRLGLAKLLSLPSQPLRFPSGTPPEASMAGWLNAAPTGFVADLERLVRLLDADAADELRTSLQSISTGAGQAIHLEADLFSNLRAPIAVWLSTPAAARDAAGRLTLTAGVESSAGVDRFIKRVAGAAAQLPAGATAAGWQAMLSGLGGGAWINGDVFFVSSASSGAINPVSVAPATSESWIAPFRALVPAQAGAAIYVDLPALFVAAADGLALDGGTVAPSSQASLSPLLVREAAIALCGAGEPGVSAAEIRSAASAAPRLLTTLESAPTSIRIVQVSVR